MSDENDDVTVDATDDVTTETEPTLAERALEAANEDTEADSQRTETTEDEGVDWEKRYKDLQAEYTPTRQELKALKEDPWANVVQDLRDPDKRQQAANWLLENLGYELPDDDENTQDDDELDELFHDPRVDGLLADRDRDRQERAMGEFNTHLNKLIGDHDLELTPLQRDRLAADCFRAGFNEQATEQTVKAYADEITAFREAVIKEYVDGKRKQPAPAVKKGASGTEHVPLDTEKARREAALQIANEAFADTA